MAWGKWWHVTFSSGKIQLASFGQSNKSDAIDVEIDGSVLEKNCLLMFRFVFP